MLFRNKTKMAMIPDQSNLLGYIEVEIEIYYINIKTSYISLYSFYSMGDHGHKWLKRVVCSRTVC